MIKKVFDPEGEERLRWGISDDRTITWLHEGGYTLETAEPYAIYGNDGVFGKYVEYPCRVEET